jgi:hypothetical protein
MTILLQLSNKYWKPTVIDDKGCGNENYFVSFQEVQPFVIYYKIGISTTLWKVSKSYWKLSVIDDNGYALILI